MTSSAYGPDNLCRRPGCVKDDPAKLPAPTGVTAAHLGGAHLDPTDREHYDGLTTSYWAAPLAVRNATHELIAHVGGYSRRTADGDDTPLRSMVEVALAACFNEIARLRQQVAHVQVDADQKVRDASRAALDCDAHGQVIYDLEKQVIGLDIGRAHTEKARLALLGEHQAITDLLGALDAGATVADPAALIESLRAANRRAAAAHTRAWKD